MALAAVIFPMVGGGPELTAEKFNDVVAGEAGAVAAEAVFVLEARALINFSTNSRAKGSVFLISDGMEG